MKSLPSVPLQLLEHVRPKEGQMLIERLAMPERYGNHLILPFAIQDGVRGAEAVVIASRCRYGVGSVVVLAQGSATRQIAFEHDHKQRIIQPCNESAVEFVLHDRVPLEDLELTIGEDHWQKHLTAEDYERPEFDGIEEGEPVPDPAG